MSVNMKIVFGSSKSKTQHRITTSGSYTPTTAELFNAVAGAYKIHTPVKVNVRNFQEKLGEVIKTEVMFNLLGREGPDGHWKAPSDFTMRKRRIMRAWTGSSEVPITDSSPYTDAAANAVRNGKVVEIEGGGVSVEFSSHAMFRDMMNRGFTTKSGKRGNTTIGGLQTKNPGAVISQITASNPFGYTIGGYTAYPKYTPSAGDRGKARIMLPATNNETAHAYVTGVGQLKRADGSFSNSYPVIFVMKQKYKGHSLSPRPFIWVSEKMIKRIELLFATGRTKGFKNL